MLGAAPGAITSPNSRQRARAQAARRGDQARVDGLDAVDGVEQDREQRADEGDEHHAALGRREHQDGQRDPGHRGDRPQHLERRQQACRAPSASGRSADPGRRPTSAAAPKPRPTRSRLLARCGAQLGRLQQLPGGLQHLGRRRHVGERDDAQVQRGRVAARCHSSTQTANERTEAEWHELPPGAEPAPRRCAGGGRGVPKWTRRLHHEAFEAGRGCARRRSRARGPCSPTHRRSPHPSAGRRSTGPCASTAYQVVRRQQLDAVDQVVHVHRARLLASLLDLAADRPTRPRCCA